MAKPPHDKPLLDTPVDLILLTLVAGSADAAGYLALGKVFTANMTGNIVLLGIAVSEGHFSDSSRALFSLLAFIVGTCAGGWITQRIPHKKPWTSLVTEALLFEAALLIAYAILSLLIPKERQLDYAYPLIGLLGLSMGLQSAAALRLGIPGINTTVVTGTLMSLLTGMMKLLHVVPDGADETKAPSLRLQALVVVVYCAGAAISGAIFFHAFPLIGAFPATVVALVAAMRLTRRG